MGILWLVVWLLFPYNKLRRRATTTQANLQRIVPNVRGWTLYKMLFRTRGLYAFSIAKGLTDPIWWFYLFYLPKFLNDNYGLGVAQVYWPIVVVYAVSSVGSFFGGALSGMRIKRGHSVNSGRKFALLLMAICVVPLLLVPHMHVLFPHNAWPAISLFALAAAAHQGWSANLFTTPTDMFPSTSVSTVVGIGGAVGSIGGALFTILVSHYLTVHPLLIFALAAFAYLLALAYLPVAGAAAWAAEHGGTSGQHDVACRARDEETEGQPARSIRMSKQLGLVQALTNGPVVAARRSDARYENKESKRAPGLRPFALALDVCGGS